MIPRTSDLFSRMMTLGRNRATLTKQLISSLPKCFSKNLITLMGKEILA